MALTPYFEIVKMTPEKAQDILLNNKTKNRNIKKLNLMKLTKAILTDNWKVTNQGIALDATGNVLDGQHRLAAIVKANKAVEVMVGFNLDPAIFNVVDTGSARSAGDALEVLDVQRSKIIATAMKHYQLYYTCPTLRWTGYTNVSHVEIVNLYYKHKEYLDVIVPELAVRQKAFKCFSLSFAIVISLLARDKGWSNTHILEYWDAVCYGANLASDNVVLSFRNQLSNPLFRRKGTTSPQQWLLNNFIKCFNEYVTRTPRVKFMSPIKHPKSMLQIISPKQVNPNIIELVKAS